MKKFGDFEVSNLFNNTENHPWTALVFPLFFISEFVGLITIVFSGELDINSIEKFVKFISEAKQTFFREIIDYIVSDWVKGNGKDSNGFIDLLQYVMASVKEDNGINEYYQPFMNNISKDNEISVYIPPFNKSYNTYMPLLIHLTKEDGNTDKCYYIDQPVENSDVKMKSLAFNVISHIQWLWQLWKSRIDTNHKKIV